MKITKTSDVEYSIVFDQTEIRTLEDIEDVFLVKPEDVIEKSIAESLRKGVEGQDRFFDDLWGERWERQ